jgi:hypothetical protein
MLKKVFINLTLLGIIFIFCTPFFIVDIKLPYILAVVFAIIIFGFSKLLLQSKIPIIPLFIGILLLLIVFIPIQFYYQYWEGGLNDGPFEGRKYLGQFESYTANDSLLYQRGYIVVYNRASNECPILAFKKNNKHEWAVELDPSLNPSYEGTKLEKIEGLSINRGLFRDIILFTGYWTYGRENGYAFIWKFNKFQRFYLSW